MKTILLVLLVALNVNAQKKKTEEYFRTGPTLESLQRMYEMIKTEKPRREQSVKYLGFNYFIYNELKKVTTPKEKDQLFAFHEINYFRELCMADNAKKIMNSSNCQTYTIRVSDYTKFSPKYLEDKRPKLNPIVIVNFDQDTYKIKGEHYSIKTAAPVGEVTKKNKPTESSSTNTNN